MRYRKLLKKNRKKGRKKEKKRGRERGREEERRKGGRKKETWTLRSIYVLVQKLPRKLRKLILL